MGSDIALLGYSFIFLKCFCFLSLTAEAMGAEGMQAKQPSNFTQNAC
jgi:hypothetical protein